MCAQTIEPLLLRAIKGKDIERPPVWLMRQAGRYMKVYRDLKAVHGFVGLCNSPELSVEVALQPMDAFDPDAAILFNDIMLPLSALGFEVDFAPGPVIGNPIRSAADIASVGKNIDLSRLQPAFSAITLLKKELENRAGDEERKAVIGFAGAPWTLASYLIDQGPFKHFLGTNIFASNHPTAMAEFLDKIADLTADYLLGQVESGADVVQMFDTWACNLNEEDFRKFALEPIRKIVEKIKPTGCPVVLFVNGSQHLLPAIDELGLDCVSVDWRTPLSAAEDILSPETCLQGNFDPTHLFRTAEEVELETKTMLNSVKRRNRFIANLGHGILQTTPPENVKLFIDTVKAGWS